MKLVRITTHSRRFDLMTVLAKSTIHHTDFIIYMHRTTTMQNPNAHGCRYAVFPIPKLTPGEAVPGSIDETLRIAKRHCDKYPRIQPKHLQRIKAVVEYIGALEQRHQQWAADDRHSK